MHFEEEPVKQPEQRNFAQPHIDSPVAEKEQPKPVPVPAPSPQPVAMPVEPTPDYAEGKNGDTKPAASQQPEPSQKDPDLSLLEASRRKREQEAAGKDQHLNHGDTIYIDQDGHFQEIKDEDVGRGSAS
jgi:hypothetical protein